LAVEKDANGKDVVKKINGNPFFEVPANAMNGPIGTNGFPRGLAPQVLGAQAPVLEVSGLRDYFFGKGEGSINLSFRNAADPNGASPQAKVRVEITPEGPVDAFLDFGGSAASTTPIIFDLAPSETHVVPPFQVTHLLDLNKIQLKQNDDLFGARFKVKAHKL